MLAAALAGDDALYGKMDTTKPPPQKRKWPQAKEESLDNSVSTVKMAMSVKKCLSWCSKDPQLQLLEQKKTHFASNSQTVASQVTTILQLTEMVSAVQQENKTIMSHFDKWTEQIAALLSARTYQPLKAQSEATEVNPAAQHDDSVQLDW